MRLKLFAQTPRLFDKNNIYAFRSKKAASFPSCSNEENLRTPTVLDNQLATEF